MRGRLYFERVHTVVAIVVLVVGIEMYLNASRECSQFNRGFARDSTVTATLQRLRNSIETATNNLGCWRLGGGGGRLGRCG